MTWTGAAVTSKGVAHEPQTSGTVDLAKTLTDHTTAEASRGVIHAGKLGPLEIVREIGHGATGTVFEAEDRKTGVRYVVKALRPEARTGIDLVRFHREAQVMKQLRHPNLMPILHFAVASDPPFYVMPQRGGRTVASLLKNGPLPVAQATRIARDVCYGLVEVHRNGIAHRDLKPDNVLIEGDGRAVVIDFGLAKGAGCHGSALTAEGALLGTPGYMSPEQCLGLPVTDRSDVYSLGVTVIEMLLGANPFLGPSLSATIDRHVAMTPRRLDAMLPGRVPEELGELVQRMIAKDPLHRPRAEKCLEVFAGVARQLGGRPSLAGPARS